MKQRPASTVFTYLPYFSYIPTYPCGTILRGQSTKQQHIQGINIRMHPQILPMHSKQQPQKGNLCQDQPYSESLICQGLPFNLIAYSGLGFPRLILFITVILFQFNQTASVTFILFEIKKFCHNKNRMKDKSQNQPLQPPQWKPHNNLSEIYVHLQTSQQAQKYCIPFDPVEKIKFQKRVHENYQNIINIQHIEPINTSSHIGQSKLIIYTDRMLLVNEKHWVPFKTTLSVLKGYRRLSSIYGWMRVNPNMIGMNEKGQIKIWINDHPAGNEPKQKTNSELLMLKDIISVINNYDQEAIKLIVNATTLNQAINILFSRGCSIKSYEISSEIYKQKSLFENTQLKAPKFIGEENLKGKSKNYPSTTNQTMIGTKKLSSPFAKLLAKKNQIHSESHTQLSRFKVPQKKGKLYKCYKKPQEVESQRFSELSSQYITECDESIFHLDFLKNRYRTQQFSKFFSQLESQKTLGPAAKEEGKVKRATSGDYLFRSNSKSHQNTLAFMQKSKQLKDDKKIHKNYKNQPFLKKKFTKNQQQCKKKKFSEKPKSRKINGSKQQNTQEKRLIKQEIAEKIKKQFNMLFDDEQKQESEKVDQNGRTLTNTNSSSRDLLIKQKVQRKKATFAELKLQAMKILNDQ